MNSKSQVLKLYKCHSNTVSTYCDSGTEREQLYQYELDFYVLLRISQKPNE